MLMDVKRVESGSMMPVTLTFEKAGELNVLVPVVPVTEATR
jgi:copper(I)-binding protein